MFPSGLLSAHFKTYCNIFYHILLDKFARIRLISFVDSSKLITHLYFSIQEPETILFARDNQNNEFLIHIYLLPITDNNIILQQFSDDQITDLELFLYIITTFRWQTFSWSSSAI